MKPILQKFTSFMIPLSWLKMKLMEKIESFATSNENDIAFLQLFTLSQKF